MVSLINHEYSRREAHGRFAWQSMPSNVLGERRGPPRPSPPNGYLAIDPDTPAPALPTLCRDPDPQRQGSAHPQHQVSLQAANGLGDASPNTVPTLSTMS